MLLNNRTLIIIVVALLIFGGGGHYLGRPLEGWVGVVVLLILLRVSGFL
jgi:hypothetical protein